MKKDEIKVTFEINGTPSKVSLSLPESLNKKLENNSDLPKVLPTPDFDSVDDEIETIIGIERMENLDFDPNNIDTQIVCGATFLRTSLNTLGGREKYGIVLDESSPDMPILRVINKR